MKTSFDLIVIGAGPGGYVAAIRAAQLGMQVVIIDKFPTLGGTCLNIGCIPSKALLDSSELFYTSKTEGELHGLKFESLTLDLQTMLQRKEKVVKKLTLGVEALMKKNNITVFRGRASLKSNNQVAITHQEHTTTFTAKKILIATGSVPQSIPHCAIDEEDVISSTEALSLQQIPKHLLVVGGGAIGLELGSVWLRLGAKVTVCELQPEILPLFDVQSARTLRRALEIQGMQFKLAAGIESVEQGKDGTIALCKSAAGEPFTMVADKILVAVGRKPYTEGLGLDILGVKTDERGYITVDQNYQTSVKDVYAVGDAIPGPMLAHKAEEEGVAFAELLHNKGGHVNYQAIPNIVYTWPEIASVGETEEQLKKRNVSFRIGRFPFAANGRALAMHADIGFVKILADSHSDAVLGAHIVGPWASDLISEVVTVMEFGGSAEDIARTVHAHPTLTEALKEAALGLDKRSIHAL